MSYDPKPLPIPKGGSSATTAAGARTAFGVAALTNTFLLDGTNPMAAAANFGGFEATNAAIATTGTSLATLAQVQSIAQGLDPKPSAVAGTTAALPANTYNNGASGVGATLTASANGILTVDGIALVLNDYVLVKTEATGANNGLYKMTTEGTAGVPYVLTRAVEMDTTTEFRGGFMFIEQGTINAATQWICTNTSNPTVGTTAITFTQTNAGSAYTADANGGLQLIGSAFSVKLDGATLSVSSAGTRINSTYPGQASIVTLGTVTTGVWNGTDIAVADGGTGASTAATARANLAAAPVAATYLVASTNAELTNANVATQGTGITIVTAANVSTFSVDAAVVVTLTGAQVLTNKTLTSPIINTPVIKLSVIAYTASHTLLTSETGAVITFNVGAAQTCTLPAGAAGLTYILKNKIASGANTLAVAPDGTDKIENVNASIVLDPGESATLTWDAGATAEWVRT